VKRFSLFRLGFAVVATALLSLLFNIIESGYIPSAREDVEAAVAGFVFMLLVYGFLVSAIYCATLFAARSLILCSLIFTTTFVILGAAWLYHFLRGFEDYKLANIAIVSNHALTSAGWYHWVRKVAETTVTAVTAALILFVTWTAPNRHQSPASGQ
jgi:hypothetical protein